jgi:hypothetical protein
MVKKRGYDGIVAKNDMDQALLEGQGPGRGATVTSCSLMTAPMICAARRHGGRRRARSGGSHEALK